MVACTTFSPSSRSTGLALDLGLDRRLDEAEGVQVLELGPRAELLAARRGRSETLASQRNCPFSMSASETPM